MTYAPPTATVRVGPLASSDAVMGYSTALAAGLMKQMVRQPRARRLRWLRASLNDTQRGLGDRVLGEINAATAQSAPRNQAVFDAIRLGLANVVAARMARMATPGMSGLGTSEADINAVFCGVIGVTTTGGALVSAATGQNPNSTNAVAQAGSGAMVANSCNAGALAQQARTAEAEANQAIAMAQIEDQRAARESRNVMLYIAMGGGVLVLLLGGLVILKKK